MNKSVKTVLGFAAAAALLSTSAISTPASAWGDSNQGRRVYTLEEINSGILGNKIVLNSIKDGPFGDERNFTAAREASAKTWEADQIVAEDGKTYIVSLYVHNNNPGADDAKAKDVTTTVGIKNTSDSTVEVNGIVSASNADPVKYWDNVVFKSKDNAKFHLEFISGSALLENNYIGKNGGVKLSDDIVSKGVKIGTYSLNGEVSGCYKYDNYVSVKVKAVYDKEPVTKDFTVDKVVRIAGTSEWKESVDAKVGDTVEFQITYKNTSNATQKGVVLKDALPANLEYVKGSTKVYNAAHQSGLTYEDSIATGIDLGAYTAGSNAIIRFKAVVKDNSMNCGANTMKNIAQVFVDGAVKNDDASVNTTKTCENPVKPDPVNPVKPQNLPDTGLTGVASGVIGAGSLVTSLGYYIASRKNRF